MRPLWRPKQTRYASMERCNGRLRLHYVPSLANSCRTTDAFGRRFKMVLQDHKHADGTRSHRDPDHRHDHGDEE